MKIPPEMISGRIDRLVPPPRKVPKAAVCSLLTGITGLFGAVFFSFGMIFVWAIGSGLHPIDDWRVAHSTMVAPAVVEEVSETNESVNEEKVFKYRFQYQPDDIIPLYAECYTISQRWREGDRAVARYVAGTPGLACLEGASLSRSPAWVFLVVLFFPITGFTLFIIPIISGWRKVKLLRYGEITGSIALISSSTNMYVNDVPVWKYSFQFIDRMGMTYTGSSKSLPTPNIGDEASEPILYLPGDPTRCMLVDSIPLKVPLGVDDSGQWFFKGGAAPVLKALLAWGLVLIHVFILIFILF